MGYRTTRRQLKRAQSKKPKNIEWVVTGRTILVGATCIVHAETREEAIGKASMGECIGEIEFSGTSVIAFIGSRAEPNASD